MGRLRVGTVWKAIKGWVAPVVLVLAVFVLVNSRISANPEPNRQELASYLATNSLNVGAQSVDGYQQVYYLYNGVQVFITKDQHNHTQPVVSGKYIAWVETIEGFPQIVLYDSLDKTTLRVTQTGTNISPSLDGNRIVWEGANKGVQQVFYFDGAEIYQISRGKTALRPKIHGNTIVYAQYAGTPGKEWQVITYDLANPVVDDRYKIIYEGGESQSWPSFVGDQIKLTP